jgi:hypothetical protein
VGKREVASAQIVTGAQHRQALIYLTATLDATHLRDLAVPVDTPVVGGGAAELESARAAGDDPPHQIDLLQRLFDGREAGLIRGGVGRPELGRTRQQGVPASDRRGAALSCVD